MSKDINQKIVHQLKIVRGQMDGIIRMIEEQEYCIPIITQLSAVDKGVKRASGLLMERHILNCVKDAGGKNNKAFNEKLDELIKTFKKFT